MAHVLKGSHSFIYTPCIHPLTEWTMPSLPCHMPHEVIPYSLACDDGDFESVQLHLTRLFCFAVFHLFVFQLHFAQTFHFILCSNVCGINPFVITGVARIFAAGMHCIFTSKVCDLFSHCPRYTGYPCKLTIHSSLPNKNFLQTWLLAIPGEVTYNIPSTPLN